jgi:hypothetical protein
MIRCTLIGIMRAIGDYLRLGGPHIALCYERTAACACTCMLDPSMHERHRNTQRCADAEKLGGGADRRPGPQRAPPPRLSERRPPIPEVRSSRSCREVAGSFPVLLNEDRRKCDQAPESTGVSALILIQSAFRRRCRACSGVLARSTAEGCQSLCMPWNSKVEVFVQ